MRLYGLEYIYRSSEYEVTKHLATYELQGVVKMSILEALKEQEDIPLESVLWVLPETLQKLYHCLDPDDLRHKQIQQLGEKILLAIDYFIPVSIEAMEKRVASDTSMRNIFQIHQELQHALEDAQIAESEWNEPANTAFFLMAHIEDTMLDTYENYIQKELTSEDREVLRDPFTSPLTLYTTFLPETLSKKFQDIQREITMGRAEKLSQSDINDHIHLINIVRAFILLMYFSEKSETIENLTPLTDTTDLAEFKEYIWTEVYTFSHKIEAYEDRCAALEIDYSKDIYSQTVQRVGYLMASLQNPNLEEISQTIHEYSIKLRGLHQNQNLYMEHMQPYPLYHEETPDNTKKTIKEDDTWDVCLMGTHGTLPPEEYDSVYDYLIPHVAHIEDIPILPASVEYVALAVKDESFFVQLSFFQDDGDRLTFRFEHALLYLDFLLVIFHLGRKKLNELEAGTKEHAELRDHLFSLRDNIDLTHERFQWAEKKFDQKYGDTETQMIDGLSRPSKQELYDTWILVMGTIQEQSLKELEIKIKTDTSLSPQEHTLVRCAQRVIRYITKVAEVDTFSLYQMYGSHYMREIAHMTSEVPIKMELYAIADEMVTI